MHSEPVVHFKVSEDFSKRRLSEEICLTLLGAYFLVWNPIVASGYLAFPFIVQQRVLPKIYYVSHLYAASFDFLRYSSALALLHVLQKNFISLMISVTGALNGGQLTG